MGLVHNIKNVFGKYFLALEQKHVQRNKKFINIEDAKTIGIVFDASDNENFDLVKKYVTYLREMKKKVKAIGFYYQKVTPAMTYSKLEYDFFSLKDLAWNNIPNNIYVDNFIEDEYDILLDLNLNDLFPLHYISSLSKARFKVGKKSEINNSIFDMMIELGNEKNLKFYLKNIDAYLFAINKTNDK
ncbi:MAG: hypothetical protein HY840_15890 [Bacteroidetes bacterium]|nr:hypothetical protein [Bacteroidota bacterium]